jgi:hypothetical protein
MITHCTYCSADKNHLESPTEAIHVYKSNRILSLYGTAIEQKVGFIILSGKFGIISPTDKIDYYDHLLIATEVQAHAELISTQIKAKGISKIVFFMNSLEQDTNLQPYLDCMKMACQKANIQLTVEITDLQD